LKKKVLLPSVIILLLLLLNSLTSILFASEMLRIAIVDFDSGGTSARPKKIAYKIKSGLIQSGKFEVISRKKVKKALDELEIPDSGMFNKSDAIKLGKKLNADMVLMGEVSNYDVDRSSFNPNVSIARVRMGRIYTITVKLDITATLIHVETGHILFSQMFSGYSHRESHDVSYRYVNLDLGNPDSNAMTKKVFDQAMSKLIAKVKDITPLIGFVLAVEGDKVVIDIGKNRKMKTGTILNVLEVKEYAHPKTGKPISSKHQIAVIKVVEVLDTISRTEVIKGKLENIKRGFVVILSKEKT